jgi:hypothetical protein
LKYFLIGILLPLIAFGSSDARYAFVTDERGSADYSTWPQASPGLTGIDAADSICRNVAQDAKLPNPSDFIAWKSNSIDDFWCRIQGLTGQRSSGCNAMVRPGSTRAGPWLRLDGRPFAPQLTELTQTNLPHLPVLFNQHGDPLPHDLSQSLHRGFGFIHFSWNSCEEWTSASHQFNSTVGSALANTVHWQFYTQSSCGMSRRLMCLQAGPAEPLDLQPPVGNMAFVSSAAMTGDISDHPSANGLSGLDAADEICRNAATQEDLRYASTFKAFLAEPGQHIADRFEHTGPWHRSDGILFLPSINHPSDDHRPDGPLVFDETGYTPGPVGVWSNVSPETYVGLENDCDGWLSDNPNDQGGGGRVGFARNTWTAGMDVSCDSLRHLYCLSDAHFTLSVAVSGSGVVVSEPVGIDCPSETCTMSAPAGTNILLAAEPVQPGSTLQFWRGAPECSDQSVCEVVLTDDLRIAAVFSTQQPRPPARH